MSFADDVKNTLFHEISIMAQTPEQFSSHPGKDFSRYRKISFQDILTFPIVMEGGTLRHELYKYFSFDDRTLSNSAYCQQRAKLLPDTFKYLFRKFNSHYPLASYQEKYRLLACDGCTFTFTRNPKDTLSYYGPDGKTSKGFNQIHTVALYHLSDKRFVDAVIQPIRKKNEFFALSQLIDANSDDSLKSIFIADRGFFAYNVFAHAIENGSYFLIRAKDKNMERLTGQKISELPENFDSQVERFLTRSSSKKKRLHPESPEKYRCICKQVRFDYLKEDADDEYHMTLRVLRFKITEDSYENMVTNLPTDEFPLELIKELYYARWDIETSFCQLKHVIGIGNFHSKKREFIEQEIWARLILYNFCSIITNHVTIKHRKRKYFYQVNYTVAFNACHYFIRLRNSEAPPKIESLIEQNILPIRPGRNYARQHRFQIPVSFTYRFS